MTPVMKAPALTGMIAPDLERPRKGKGRGIKNIAPKGQKEVIGDPEVDLVGVKT